jgi:hypothetical protein
MSCNLCHKWQCKCGANMADKNSYGLQIAELRAQLASAQAEKAELVRILAYLLEYKLYVNSHAKAVIEGAIPKDNQEVNK